MTDQVQPENYVSDMRTPPSGVWTPLADYYEQQPQKPLAMQLALLVVGFNIGFIVPLGEWVIRQACTTAALIES